MQAFTWSTASTPLAAAFAACGFIVRSQQTEIIELRHALKQRFSVSPTSQWSQLDRDGLRNAYGTGGLLKADPLHPFLQALRAAHNYSALLKHQATGERFRLASCGVGCWQYEPGIEDSTLSLSRGPRTTDLPLAAALGVIGIPVIDIEGDQGRRFYVLPAHGMRSAPEWQTLDLIRRSVPGQTRLVLEDTQPQHPLCSAYQGAYSYALLLAHCKKQAREVLLKSPNSNRRALIPENPSSHLLDQVRTHFRISA